MLSASLAPLLAALAAVCLIGVMYYRAPLASKRGSWSTAPEPTVPGRGAAWREAKGAFDASGVARQAGDLSVFEVPLSRPLRRPPLSSTLDPRRPAPGTVHLRVEHAENCAGSSLRALTSGQPRCSSDALILAVNVAAAGPFRIRGNFEVRA